MQIGKHVRRQRTKLGLLLRASRTDLTTGCLGQIRNDQTSLSRYSPQSIVTDYDLLASELTRQMLLFLIKVEPKNFGQCKQFKS